MVVTITANEFKVLMQYGFVFIVRDNVRYYVTQDAVTGEICAIDAEDQVAGYTNITHVSVEGKSEHIVYMLYNAIENVLVAQSSSFDTISEIGGDNYPNRVCLRKYIYL